MANVSSSNSQKELVPRLRFPAYRNSWSIQRIGDFLTESKIPGTDGKLAKKLSVKLWAKGVVEKNTTFEGSENTQYYIRRAGQFMYGKLDFLNCAFGIVPTHLDGYESTLDAPAFDIRGIDPVFLLNRVIQRSFYKKNGDIANGSRKAKRIHPDTFLDMELICPSMAEQEKIADFIIRIDARIDAQSRLVDALKSYKRGLLNAFFSREICFAENAAWEVRQFKTVAELRKDKYDPAKEAPATCIELEHIEQGTGRILGHTMAETQSSIKNKFLHGDVLFGKLRPYLRKYALPGFEGVCSSEIWVLTPKHGVLSQYLYYLVQSDQFVATANISSGTKMPRAEWSKISAERIFVPNEPEQEKICNTLEALDRGIDSALITLTKLDQLKSGLLQRMFI